MNDVPLAPAQNDEAPEKGSLWKRFRAWTWADPIPYWVWPIIGGVSALGFAPIDLFALTLIALALVIGQSATVGVRRAFWIGWLFGLGHFVVSLRWIAVAFTYQAAMPEWLGYLGVVLLSLYLALFPAVTAMAARWLIGQRIGVPFVLAFAGFWIISEYLRSQLFTGFAWNPLAVILAKNAEPAAFVGTYGLSGLLILASGGIAILYASKKKEGLLCFAFAAIAMVVPQFFVPDYPLGQKNIGSTAITVVQPNIGQTDKHRPGYEAINFAKLAENTSPQLPISGGKIGELTPRLIFWPEAAIPWSLESGMPPWIYSGQPGGSAAGTRVQLAMLTNPGDVLLTGADRYVLDKAGDITAARNSVFAVNSDATLAPWRYDKAHLVPYGEYLPMKDILKPLGIDRLVPGDIDFLPGPGPQTVPLIVDGRTLKMGVQICYEIIFSGEVADRANRPDFIFNPSNDAWFGTVGPPQHLAQARLRAVEEGLPIIRSTPTGISAVINPDGSLAQSLPHGVAGRIDMGLPKAAPPTFFSLYGNTIPLTLAGIFILLSFVANRRATR